MSNASQLVISARWVARTRINFRDTMSMVECTQLGMSACPPRMVPTDRDDHTEHRARPAADEFAGQSRNRFGEPAGLTCRTARVLWVLQQNRRLGNGGPVLHADDDVAECARVSGRVLPQRP